MDRWNTTVLHHHHRHHLRDNRNPSFSSTLLDQIYNSIDDSSTTNSKKHQNQISHVDNRRKPDQNQNSLNDNRGKTGDDFTRSKNRTITEPIFFKHSTSTSSDSSGFSSSESESFYKRSNSIPHPKPIRTEKSHQQTQGSFTRTKSKASKMYSDLKKVKQPISPGGRIATFLNSIFTGTVKKPAKINTRAVVTVESSTTTTTTCSSASSFSRSCLSNKTPSSNEKSKRSVRFMDEEANPKVKLYDRDENRRVIEAAKELLRTYQKSKDVKISDEDEDEEEDDDLFEIGIEKFREELPVYETTRLNTVSRLRDVRI